ncbi:MAG TPA: HD domain-containing phosphohydrolase [Gemmatimonadaceae bacterium]
MNRKLILYRTATICFAVFTATALYVRAEHVSRADLSAIVLLSVLAVIAELLAFAMPNSARGSIAFIPYLAAALVVPTWATVAGVAVVKAVVETVRRSKPVVALMNIALHGFTVCCAIWVYLALGGTSLLAPESSSLLSATRSSGVAALFAVAISFFLNTSAVCIYLALNAQQRIAHLWRQNVRPTIAMDLLAGPIVFIFAWLYAAHGAIAAAALWVPLLGIREVQRVNLELHRTNEELLQLMIKSIEARDLYTSGHSRRVQKYSTLIARGLGLAEREVELIGKAALLHDLGKIYEKYAPILRKADKLTADEWSTMQEHPIDGANLVATMSGLKEIIPAIRHHHENWDGSGYPDGISGNRIPLAARIISFADTIDAMTSERPYRRPLTEAQVRSEIMRCRGRQFDPTIADRIIASPIWQSLFQPAKRTASPAPALSLLVSSRGVRESA